MRGPLALVPLAALALALAGCSKEDDFDQRFDRQADKLEAAASNIQADIENQIEASRAAGRDPGNAAVLAAQPSVQKP
jgi:outer membrane murein-binding lipoprotein Lpp